MEGGCYCGALRYRVSGQPVMKAQCHCRECQYHSGGGPNFFLIIPNDGFSFTQGTAQEFKRPDLEQPVTRQFCATCGTHLTTLLKARGLTVVKVGTLDDPAADYHGPKMAIHMKDTQPYMTVPDGLPCFDGLPPRA
ncbi:GFA family protein [Phaeobacter marinintestinus]|uniref:GFA family protein n=1 Tax=Falsiphaeobacter marinintestinus TaxID=1492905 RepID=UPI0011B3CE85|nr:GFA family protein [Phaeobacter marinintestinus]